MNICELLESSNTQSSEDDTKTQSPSPQIEDTATNTNITTTTTTQENLMINTQETTSTQLTIAEDSIASLTDSNDDEQIEFESTNITDELENQSDVVVCSEEYSADNEQNTLDAGYTTNSTAHDLLISNLMENNYAQSSQDINLGESSNDSDSSTQNYNQNNIDFGHSILINSSLDDEFNFDRLGPFEKLCSLCENPTPSNMESASKYLVPALEFCSTQDDFMLVFTYLRKYCFFSDILLRSLWLEQIQNIIQFIHQEGENIPVEFKDNFNMATELALLISDLMQEPTYQVKKYATASLLCIVEKQLLNNEQIEKIIIPSLLNLVKENNEDFHIECISLFGKLSPLVGREMTAKYFLEPFCRLSTSPVFHTRKACASNITEIANIVSTEDVEKYLIPHFCEFLKDQVWAIRKVCADIFSQFAVTCRRKTREQVLTEYFIRLLDDNSRWVKISAYKSLGPFIATFSREGSSEDQTDEIEDLIDSRISELPDSIAAESQPEQPATETLVEAIKETDTVIDVESGEEGYVVKSSEEMTDYNNFNYWRPSIPSLEDATKQKDEKKATDTSTLGNITISSTSNLATESKTNSLESLHINSKAPTYTLPYTQLPITDNTSEVNYSGLYSSTISLYSNLNQKVQRPTDMNQLSEQLKQNVVPSILLSYFITMVEMNAHISLDAETNYNCAFNFPAIALTLGLANWKYVKELYKKLAEDNNWKVRQTLAYSIHELALILGTECTQNELVPVFDNFIKDVDEVRMGIVRNLSKFLGVLSLEFRRSYMPKLNDFLKMDNSKNWRFRNELGLQIAEFCELFPTDCIADYIQPVTFMLALDKVAEVRVTSIKALTIILKQFEIKKDEKYRRDFLNDVIRTFADNNKWSFRQLFVVLCDTIFKEHAYNCLDAISTDLLPKLFSLRNDKVANIRVCLARVISTYLLNIDYFTCGQNPICNELNLTIEYLSKDSESDVRTFFVDLSAEIVNEPSTSLPAYEEVIGGYNMQQSGNSGGGGGLDAAAKRQNEINDYELQHDDRLNDSLNLINAQVMSYNDNQEDINIDEEDDEDDDDEIIDTTKVGQLKIVSELDNYMEDDCDEIIDTSPMSPMSPDTIPMKIANLEPELICNLNNHMDRTNINDSNSSIENS